MSGSARSAAVVGVSQVSNSLLAIASLAVMSRLLSPTSIGLYAMIVAITALASLLRDLGLSLAAIQAPALSEGQKSNLFWVNLASGLVLFGVMAGASRPIGEFYSAPQIAPAVVLVSTVFIFDSAAAQYRVGLVRESRFISLAVVDISGRAAGLIASIVAALMGAGFWAIIIGQVLTSVWGLVAVIIAAPWIPTAPSRAAPVWSFVKFGTNLLGVQVLTYAVRNVDNILIGKFLGARQLGFYSRAYSLYAQPQTLTLSPFTNLAVRTLAPSVSQPAEYRRKLLRIQKIGCYFALVIFAAFAALAMPLVQVFLGPGWEETAGILRILSLGGFFQVLGNVYYWVFLSEGKTHVHLRCVLISQPISLALIAVGIFFGAEGVAWAATSGMAIEAAIPAIWGVSKTAAPRLALLRNVVRPCAVSIILGIAMWAAIIPLAELPPVLQLLLGGVAAVVSLAAITVLWRKVRFDLQEILAFVRSAVRARPASTPEPRI